MDDMYDKFPEEQRKAVFGDGELPEELRESNKNELKGKPEREPLVPLEEIKKPEKPSFRDRELPEKLWEPNKNELKDKPEGELLVPLEKIKKPVKSFNISKDIDAEKFVKPIPKKKKELNGPNMS